MSAQGSLHRPPTYTHPGFDYQTVEVQDDVGAEAQIYADQGWRVVSVYPKARPGHFDIVSYELLLERVKQNPHAGTDLQKWAIWADCHGPKGYWGV